MSAGGTYEKEFTLPSGINPDNYYVYIETTDGNRPFNVYFFGIKHKVPKSDGAKEGYAYDTASKKYISNNSNYTVELDENSVTSPLKLDNNGEYSVDTEFSREILIPQGNLYEDEDGKKWGYHWTKQDLNEQNNVMYRYWIEEVKIGDDDISTQVKVAGDDKIVESTHEDYLISYDRQFVATNTENAPILVKNKYIWYKLPATGGRGTTGIYVLGGFLTAMGILSGCAAYKRKRRRD
jgi:LPXTG-motif cell wall-anchored protein